jgi:hypothetical protein
LGGSRRAERGKESRIKVGKEGDGRKRRNRTDRR